MAMYSDMFVMAVPKKNLAAYRTLARKFSRFAKKYGALEYRECVQDAIEPKAAAMLGKSVDLKKDEVIVISYINYKSKAIRTRSMKLMMADEGLKKLMSEKPIFDYKRMIYGGFKELFGMK